VAKYKFFLFQFAIDTLKATVPIWKKEVYEDGTEWKANAECPWKEKEKHPKVCKISKLLCKLRGNYMGVNRATVA
jgi:hypothetical protein